jgi:5-methylcytosine-specific restriction protein A
MASSEYYSDDELINAIEKVISLTTFRRLNIQGSQTKENAIEVKWPLVSRSKGVSQMR